MMYAQSADGDRNSRSPFEEVISIPIQSQSLASAICDTGSCPCEVGHQSVIAIHHRRAFRGHRSRSLSLRSFSAAIAIFRSHTPKNARNCRPLLLEYRSEYIAMNVPCLTVSLRHLTAHDADGGFGTRCTCATDGPGADG